MNAVVVPLILVQLFFGRVYLSDEGDALVRDLLDKYPKYIRPVKQESTPVVVRHRLTPIQMIDMDEKNQIITIKCWLSQKWTDEYLLWDPDLYGGITQIQVPIIEVWQPDITLFGSVSEEFQRHYDTDAIIDYDGTVTSLQPFVIRCTCAIDATYFPFDEQECRLKFASWSYDIKFIDMVADNASNTDRFVTNGEWELVGMPIRRREEMYVCCADPFPDITYVIHLKRRSLFYIFNIIFPSFLACVLVAVGFYLPSDSGERITLCVTSILSQFVFLTIVGEFMPPNSEYIPHLQRYFFVSIGLVVVSAVVTACSLSMHFKGPGCEEVPPWMRKLAFRYLARIVCTEVRLRGRFSSNYLRSTRSARRNSITRNSMATYSGGGEDIPLEQHNNICLDQDKAGAEKPADCETHLMEKTTNLNNRGGHARARYGKERRGHVDNMDIEVYEKRLREWREVARILDRSFFIFYILLLVLLIIGFLSFIAIGASHVHAMRAQEEEGH